MWYMYECDRLPVALGLCLLRRGPVIVNVIPPLKRCSLMRVRVASRNILSASVGWPVSNHLTHVWSPLFHTNLLNSLCISTHSTTQPQSSSKRHPIASVWFHRPSLAFLAYVYPHLAYFFPHTAKVSTHESSTKPAYSLKQLPNSRTRYNAAEVLPRYPLSCSTRVQRRV